MNTAYSRATKRLLLSTAAATLSMIGTPVLSAAAESSAAPAAIQARVTTVDDIIVTARKRDETSIAVPVTITAVGREELEKRNITSIDDVARLVPSLVVGEGVTVQGGNLVLRGISGLDSNPFADQAISFNVDGVQVAKTSIRRLAEMDMQQVEVLKGPQPLFYGKNSPGGVISIRTADPTDHFEAKLSTGYEFRGHEWTGDGYVSGPLTDTLGLRLAAYGSDLRGWAKSTIADTAFFAPRDRWGPNHKEYALRGTLKFNPNDRFDARLKISHGHITGAPFTANYQLIACPLGAPQNAAQPDDCTGNSRNADGDFPASYAAIDSRFGDGSTFAKQSQTLAGLEMNYHLSDDLALTSVSGYYRFGVSGVGKIVTLASINDFAVRELTEELRLTSSFSGPLNFTIGGHYQDSHAHAATTVFIINRTTNLASQLSDAFLVQDGTAYSAFGQLIWNVLPDLELAGGGRFSHESKVLPVVLFAGGSPVRVNPLPSATTPDTRGTWNDFSPEITLAYRPTPRLTVFGSYKHGFLSGGFNSGSTTPQTSLKYNPQTIKGFEGGVKAVLFDNQVRANLSIYDYRVKDLQNQVSIGILQTITNVGKSSTKGVDLDGTFRPAAIQGLTFRGAVSYNRARYLDFLANCFSGERTTEGCVPTLVGGQLQPRQDLAGTPLVRAPEWTGNIGVDYDTSISEGLKLGLSADLQYSDSYIAHSGSKHDGDSPSYTIINASIRLAAKDDRWELALIGKNLTEQYYWLRSSDVTGTGSGTGTAAGVHSDTVASVTRGRQVLLRATVKFGQ
jgi:iron complex outermembrane receptor protein